MVLVKLPLRLKEIKVEVIQTCPLDCIHCSSEANHGKTQCLDERKVVEILEDAVHLGAEEVTFSGGEPLLWKPLIEVVKYARGLNLRPTIYSTGINQVEIQESNSKTAKELKNAGLHKVVFSIYGSQEKSHELITRVHGSFLKTVEAIQFFVGTDIFSEVHFVPLKHNFMELGNVCKLAEELGVRKVSLLRFVPHGRGTLVKEFEHLGHKETLELKKSVEEVRNRYRSRLTVRLGSPYNILLLEEHIDCNAAMDRLIISPNGKVYPCDAFKGYDDINDKYGSIINYRLPEVWKKSVYLGTVRKYLTTEFPEPCRSCQELQRCKSGCLAQKVLLNGDFRKDKDPDCLLYPSHKRRKAI